MARLLIAGRYIEPRPVTQHEAGWLLRGDSRAARNGLRRGDLTTTWVGRRRHVDPASLVTRLADDSLAQEALAGLLEGRIRLPHPSQPTPDMPQAVACAAIAHEPWLMSVIGPDEPEIGRPNMGGAVISAVMSAHSDAVLLDGHSRASSSPPPTTTRHRP